MLILSFLILTVGINIRIDKGELVVVRFEHHVRKHVIYARRVYVLVLHQSRTITIIQPTKTTITTLRDISLRSCVPTVIK